MAEVRRTSLRAVAGGTPLGAIFLGASSLACLAVGLLHLDRFGLPVCIFKATTGWPCLTCGATRALARLYELDLAGAAAMNPLAVLVAFTLVPWGTADVLLMTRGRALALELSPGTARALRILAVALLAANWVYLAAVRR